MRGAQNIRFYKHAHVLPKAFDFLYYNYIAFCRQMQENTGILFLWKKERFSRGKPLAPLPPTNRAALAIRSVALLGRLPLEKPPSPSHCERSAFLPLSPLRGSRVRISLRQRKKPPFWVAFVGGEGEIRTLEPLLTVTRFPIVRARPATRLLQVLAVVALRPNYNTTKQCTCQYLFKNLSKKPQINRNALSNLFPFYSRFLKEGEGAGRGK